MQGIFLTVLGQIEHTRSSAHGWRLFVELLFICVHPKLLSPWLSSTWCCPPVISSIIIDPDEFFDLPFQGGG